ncbi:hypothetical protein RSAG8_05175, partial [Rhizoctonia solani AG-8 WAC10335]
MTLRKPRTDFEQTRSSLQDGSVVSKETSPQHGPRHTQHRRCSSIHHASRHTD